MAILATAVWEFDPGGSNNSGGGFDSGIAGAGTDYSQQTSAQLSLSDLAMVTAGTTLTSATGGFTSAMVGNCIHITAGTNFTAGFYFITGYTDTNTVTIDRDATTGSDGSSGTGAVGGALAVFTDTLLERLTAGNKIWVKNNGTMTLTGGISISLAGSSTAPIVIDGYNSSRGDKPTLANRPTIACGANSFTIGLNWQKYNIIHTTTASTGAATGSSSDSIVRNCKSTNSSGTANRDAFYCRDANHFFCEGISTNGQAFDIDDGPSLMFGCYAHDSLDGFRNDSTGDVGSVVNCVADTCTGIGVRLSAAAICSNTTIYNCGTGVSFDGAGSAGLAAVFNSIISDCTTGVSQSSAHLNNHGDYNLYYNNTADTSNFTKGSNSVVGNPNFTDAANGDFTCTSGGAGIDICFDYTLVGLTGSYKINAGLDQDDNAAGGGETSYAYA
jgi:hypothetical protein